MDWDTFWGDAWPWAWPSLVAITWLVLSSLASRRMLTMLAKRAETTDNPYDDELVPALKRPLMLVVVIVTVMLWAEFTPLPDSLAHILGVVTQSLLTLTIVMVVDAVLQTWLVVKARSSRVLATSGGVLRVFARVVVYIIGGLMVLASMGIDITPLIASLGVGSLAIGLALQKTLEDFISGLLLAADQPVRVGDYVDVDSLSGTVLRIGWRSARIETRDKMHVIVPNSVLAQSKVVNRSRPTERVEFTVGVGVGYESDLKHVADVLAELADRVHRDSPDAAEGFSPIVLVERFGASSIDFVVWCSAVRWLQRPALMNAMIHAIHARFREEGINIPFPIRTLDLPPSSPLLKLAEPARLDDLRDEGEAP
ncbi:MAG: hypothetical protein CSA66_02645 [Proteobacteria bacterium]|nr:MAG: hypothetical protein CSA66_02645 [Pseudomonadota bacterium]